MSPDSFSERHGYKPKKEIQIERIDDDLRNRIWNNIYHHFPSGSTTNYIPGSFNSGFRPYAPSNLMRSIWEDFFKADADSFSIGQRMDHIRWLRDRYTKLEWSEVYDLLEFIVSKLDEPTKRTFIDNCNTILQSENSGYRFLGDKVTPITDKEEIKEVEQAQNSIDVVKTHVQSSLSLYSNRTNPDYRNSIKESISAIEALCKVITKNNKATLGDALKDMRNNSSITIHPALLGAFSQIYGWTSSGQGIRHGISDADQLYEEDARFMLIACSAFVNYLISKAQRAGISIS